MTKRRRFVQCDVFSETPFKGNALAVVVDGDGLSDNEMQCFARWTNLAETTFLLTPEVEDADYKVRIFTPVREMPFAGHPTLGSSMVWLRSGGMPKNPERIRQQCNIGVIDIDLTSGKPAFAAPETSVEQMHPDERRRISARMGLPSALILNAVTLNNGPVWQVFELPSAQDVLAVDAQKVSWPEFQAIGLIGKSDPAAPSDFEVRMLAPSSGMSEDPITGSLNAALARWLQSTGCLPDTLKVSQGRAIQRDGLVNIRLDKDGCVWVGGDVHVLIEGTVWI